jgi:hypothetical protein
MSHLLIKIRSTDMTAMNIEEINATNDQNSIIRNISVVSVLQPGSFLYMIFPHLVSLRAAPYMHPTLTKMKNAMNPVANNASNIVSSSD